MQVCLHCGKKSPKDNPEKGKNYICGLCVQIMIGNIKEVPLANPKPKKKGMRFHYPKGSEVGLGNVDLPKKRTRG